MMKWKALFNGMMPQNRLNCACLNSRFGNVKLVQMRVTLDLPPRK
jgi:hypothetical protein